MQAELPESLRKSQRSAASLAAELAALQVKLDQAAAAKHRDLGGSDVVRLGSEYARAKVEWEQKRAHADFACLVLGRDCAQANFSLPEIATDLQAAKELQNELQS